MKKTILVNLPVDVIWQFREFKREQVPAPRISFITNYDIDEIADHIQSQGAIEPLELSIIGNQALLTDGNHRIVAAKRLGYTIVPVNIVLFFGEASDTFYDHTLERFRPISRHLELWLRRIFLLKLKSHWNFP